jgi:signal transduction histidine kinase
MNRPKAAVETDAWGEREASSPSFAAYERHMAVAVLCSELAHGLAPAMTFLREMLREAQMSATDRSIGEEELARLKALLSSLRRTKRRETLPRAVDVAEAIQNAVERARSEGYDTSRAMVRSELRTIWAQERALELALVSLLRNAFDAAPEGAVSVSAREANDRLCVEVSDDGAGLPEPLIEQVFHPLAALAHDGLGTGLAIVLRIVRDHGWELSHARREGHTVFALDISLEGPQR